MKKVFIVLVIILLIASIFVTTQTASSKESELVINPVKWKCPPDLSDPTLPPLIPKGKHADKRLYVAVDVNKAKNKNDFKVYCSDRYEYWASFPDGTEKEVDTCEWPINAKNIVKLTITGNATQSTGKNGEIRFNIANGTIKKYYHNNYYTRRSVVFTLPLGLEGKGFIRLFDYGTRKDEYKYDQELIKGEDGRYRWKTVSSIMENENFGTPSSSTGFASSDAPCTMGAVTSREGGELLFIPSLAVSYDSIEVWGGGAAPVLVVPTGVPPVVALGAGPGGLASLPGVPGSGRPQGGQPPGGQLASETPTARVAQVPSGGQLAGGTPAGEQLPSGQSAVGVPTIPIAQVPREEEEPKDKAPPEKRQEEDTPQTPLPVLLTVKAKQTVLAGGAPQTVAIAEAMIKLDVGPEPALPLAGNSKDDTGYAESPIQGLTSEDGMVVLAVPAGLAAAIPASYRPADFEVDLTPRSNTIVGIDVDTSKENWAQAVTYLHPDLGPYVSRNWLQNGTLVVVLYYPKERAAAVKELIALSNNVAYTEQNYCRGKQPAPNDLYFLSKGAWKQRYDDQWAIKRVGFTAEGDSAWKLVDKEKASPVVVAVIDTGLDWNHQDISWDNIWINKNEIPDNGIDDDKNGYVDDIIGWDFFRNTNKPWDRDGHGTFVAGVIAANQNNDVGIAGINSYAKIMVLKALNNFGNARASSLAEAIVYAASNGARVINVSVGGKNLTRTEQDAINHAHSKGAVIVVAAGNEGIDVKDFGPAGLKNVITVASTDLNDKRAVFSNWGAGIDIAAPGLDVLSLRARRTDLMRDIPGVKYTPGKAYVGKDKRYYRASGTSFSAPIVAGVASLIFSRYPQLTNEEVKRMLLQSTRDIEVPGKDQHTGFGLLDARAALSADPGFFVEAVISGVQVAKVGGKTVLRVLGTADANAFGKAWIELGPGKNSTKWKKVSRTIAIPVKGGTLDELAAGNFHGSKQWVLRLIVEHQNGRRSEVRFNLKLG